MNTPLNIPKKPAKPYINNTELVNQFRAEGGRLFHIHPNPYRRGMTIAYRERSGHIEVATALTHRADCFEKKIGTKTAIEHFNAGRVISVPKARNGALDSLRSAFMYNFYQD